MLFVTYATLYIYLNKMNIQEIFEKYLIKKLFVLNGFWKLY